MKVMFVTVGTAKKGGEESLAGSILKSIYNQNPEYVVFLCSKDSKSTAELVISMSNGKLKCGENCKIEEGIDSEDMNKAFEKISEIIEKTIKNFKPKPDNIVVNYTSGTKSMAAAAALVGISFNSDFIYVAVEKDKDRNPIPGTEKVIHMQPYKVRDSQLLREIASYFSKYYIFTSWKLSSKLVAYPYKSDLQKILEGYWMWNLFKYSTAHEKLKEANKDIIKNIFEDETQFEKNLKFLKACRGISENRDNLEAKDLKVKFSYVIVDLLLNAERMIEIGRFDDAVSRLYRALEMVAQLELLKYGYEDPIPVEDIKEEDRDIFNKYPREKGKYKLGLYKKMELLEHLGSEMGKKFIKDSEIKDVLEYRNLSFLAHGFKPVEESKAQRMKDIVEKYAKLSFGGIKGINFDRIKDMGKFPKMK